MVRLRRAVRVALAALATLLVIVGTPSLAQHPQRIVAVGDLHGDFQAWTAIARAAGLVDGHGHWAGGATVLVQDGDITDRGPDSLKIIRNLQQLQKEAPRKGGKVVVVLGNHEAMQLLGDFRYTTPGEYAAFVDDQSAARRDRVYELNKAAIEAAAHAKDPKLTPEAIRAQWLAETPLGWVEHKLAWAPSGELGKWAARNPAVVKISDTVFVHGGLSAEYAATGIDEINRRVAAAMAAADDTPASILTGPLGPLWYRGLTGRDPDAEAERPPATNATPRPTIDQELTAVLAATGAKRIVIGHTPILTGIAILNGGRLVRIDTGISRYYGGPLTWLEIVGDQLTPHTVGRPAP
ncbi:metallophosphoesterase [Sphingomonas limnosediminicola]|uniref:metallophosphoesterase n=1 Tax=Sphingomonas limnosediminicola TaxID=940133 RepID=UPI0031D0FD1A